MTNASIQEPRPRVSPTVAAAAVLAAACAFLPGAPSAAEPNDAHPGTQALRWDYVQSAPIVSDPVCDDAGHCARPFAIASAQASTGDVAGTGVQAGGGTLLPDGTIYANSVIVFSGTLGGCGTGSVVMRSTGFNRAGVTSGDIEIVDGTGTGELTGISGTGEVVDGRTDPGGGGQGTGSIVLKVRCTPKTAAAD
jgi:hypothetical protein